MKKYIVILSLSALPFTTFAAVTLNPVTVSKGSATVSGATTGGATTVVTANGSEIVNTASASWTDTRNYKSGQYTVKATASDGSSAEASFSISGSGVDPMSFPCAFGTKGSCTESIASGEVIFTPWKVDGCEYSGGCVRQAAVPKQKFVHLKYGEKGCDFFMGCVREL